ncbi:MAG: hypothetical protein M3Q08_07250 [Pseudomonadota bacterium]|jgi:small-conductance mechanosensitive channel|nr:hypothetical protein [Pseudomonadota bacterium]
MKTQTIFWAIAAAALLLVVFSGFAERRQASRKNLDRPGWISWPLMQVLGVIGMVVAAVLALKG